ncbi:photosystem reaction center protein H [Paracoccus sp. PAR01]|uniref:photosystem reaction center protein H n=1 Tax=Paracoccus sp. PAR01 TaxID=2769282 RepID=UPI0017853E69|nr:photosystem reaction center protein H [Paracoccus sp. PAR01]MBD9529869.1 photosystem reaction center protein H [Paracoccus sp. PAR01]
MTHLVTATAFVLSLGLGAAVAQTAPDPAASAAAPSTMPVPQITAPEGFLAEQVVFSAGNLDGATVYDATGQQIGEVHALVLSNGETSPAAAMPSPTVAPTPADPAKDATSATGEALAAADDTISGVGSDVNTTTPTEATTPPVQFADGAATTQGADVTEAIIDVGGFLGMGEHRVAIPIKELVAYRKDTELRIYLPWTREQLLALPRFEDKPPA